MTHDTPDASLSTSAKATKNLVEQSQWENCKQTGHRPYSFYNWLLNTWSSFFSFLENSCKSLAFYLIDISFLTTNNTWKKRSFEMIIFGIIFWRGGFKSGHNCHSRQRILVLRIRCCGFIACRCHSMVWVYARVCADEREIAFFRPTEMHL